MTKIFEIRTLGILALLFAFFIVFVGVTVEAANWGDVRISEVLYYCGGQNHTYEFIELYNPKQLNLSDWKIFYRSNDFNENTSDKKINITATNKTFVLLKNNQTDLTNIITNTSGCYIQNGSSTKLFGTGLNNDGAVLKLYDNKGNLIDYFNYTKVPSSKKNYSIEKIFLKGWNDPSNWRESKEMYGTPCRLNDVLENTTKNSSSCGINLVQNISVQNYYRTGEKFLSNSSFLTGGFWNPLNLSFDLNISVTNMSSNSSNITFLNVTNQSKNQSYLSFIIPNISNGTYNLTQDLSNLIYWRDSTSSCALVYKQNATSCSNCSCALTLNFTILPTLNASINITPNKQLYNNINDEICINSNNSYISNSNYSNINLSGSVRYYIINDSYNATYNNATPSFINISPNNITIIKNKSSCFNTSNLSAGKYWLCAEVYDNKTNLAKEDTFGRQIKNCTSLLVGTYKYNLSLTNTTSLCQNNTNLSLNISLLKGSMNITNGIAFLVCTNGSKTLSANKTFNLTSNYSVNAGANSTTVNSTVINFTITNTNSSGTSTCYAFIQISGVNLTDKKSNNISANCAVNTVTTSGIKKQNKGSNSLRTVSYYKPRITCNFASSSYPKEGKYYLVNTSNPIFNFSIIEAQKRLKEYRLSSDCGAQVEFKNKTARKQGEVFISLPKEGRCKITAKLTTSGAEGECDLFLKYKKPVCKFNISSWKITPIEENNKTKEIIVTLVPNNCSGKIKLEIKANNWSFSPNENETTLSAGEEKNITFLVKSAGKDGDYANINLVINGSKIDSDSVRLKNVIKQKQNNTASTGLFLAGKKNCAFSWLWFIFFVVSAIFLFLGYRIFRQESILSGVYARKILLYIGLSGLLALIGLFVLFCNGWVEEILLIGEILVSVLFALYLFYKSKIRFE